MNGLPYYKAYPRDFIEGTIGMSFELKGAYRLVLDLIYMQGGYLPNDDRYVSGLLGCTIRKWKALKGQLVECGKLQTNGEFLTNERAVIELEITRKLSDKQSENRSNPNKNNKIKSPKLDQAEAEPEAEADTTLSSVVRAPPDDLEILKSKLLDATGENGIQPHGSIVLGPIIEMLAAGVNLEVDILPTIKAKVARMPRPAGSWSYFVPAIRDAYERRVSAGRDIPKNADDFKGGTMMRSPDGKSFVQTTEARWKQRVEAWQGGTAWSALEWGPAPGGAGCHVPGHLLHNAIERAA